MLAVHLTLTEGITIATFLLLCVGTTIAIVKLGVGRRNGGAQGKTLASYDGVSTMIEKESTSRQREHDALRDIVKANAIAIGENGKTIGRLSTTLAKATVKMDERHKLVEAVRSDVSTILEATLGGRKPPGGGG